MLPEFKSFDKIPRLSKLAWSITEKIDGTNGIVHITDDAVYAGSRKRWLLDDGSKGWDNFGFGKWVYDHEEELRSLLGVGRHVGEWWGQGIQRGYGQDTKRFSLFTPWRYPHLPFPVEQAATGHCVSRVPILQLGGNVSTLAQALKLWDGALRRVGSVAAPGFMQPEGYAADRDWETD